jgi:hypothetical protein
VAFSFPAQQTRYLFKTHHWFFNLVAVGVTLYLLIAHVQTYCVSVYSLLTYLLTYLLTPRSRVLLEKPTGSQLVKKFPTFYGIRFSLPY